jgi:Fic family protein
VVASFMDYFEKRFSPAEARAGSRILAIPAAHHRLNYIHPFIDGNGRVSRLMSHAMVLRAGISGGGLWSISRGLARGLAGRHEYKMAMNAADSPRRGDLDGRGTLSQAALIEFSDWFMKVMLDQIRFSKAVFRLDGIEERYKNLLVHLNLEPRAVDLVAAVFRMGQLERGDAASALRVPERTARNSVSKLTQMGFLKSATPKGALRIAFPIDYREKLFPNLFADAPIEAPARPAHKFGP